MATRHAETEQAVLNMLQRYEMMTIDEILTSVQPDFCWAQVFLAIDRLSRQKLIALYRTGSTYQLTLNMQENDIEDRVSTHGALAVSECTGTRSDQEFMRPQSSGASR
jgi:predicted transcriptional regulator